MLVIFISLFVSVAALHAVALWYVHRESTRTYPMLPGQNRGTWKCEGIVRALSPGVPTPDGRDSCVLWCDVSSESGAGRSNGAPFVVERFGAPSVVILMEHEDYWREWSTNGGKWNDAPHVFRDGDLIHLSGTFVLGSDLDRGYRDRFPSLRVAVGRPHNIAHGTVKAATRRALLFSLWVFVPMEVGVIISGLLAWIFDSP